MIRRVLPLLALAGSLAFAACGPHITFVPWGATCPSQPRDCEFEVISHRPAREYQVIGMMDIEGFSIRAVPKDEATFRRVVHRHVCEAGGDAVIPGISSDGRYLTATVVKWVDEGQTEPVCRPDAGVDGGADAGAAADAAPDAAAEPSDAGVAPFANPETMPATTTPTCDGGASC